MDLILKTVSKYAIILIVQSLFGHTWFYLKNLFIKANSIETMESFWYMLPNYTGYLVQLLIGVLLLIDIQKLNKKYYLIPVAGLFYPLLGITMLLIATIYEGQRIT